MKHLELENEVCYRVYATDDTLNFHTISGKHYQLYHEQNCCESVYIDDINGDLANLIDTPILYAVEKSNEGTPEDGESVTWTFYTFRTRKGTVDITWKGSSNGYYSESVDLSIEEEPVPQGIFDKYKEIYPEHLV